MPAIIGKAASAAKRNLVFVSDSHIGCQVGLMHPDGAELDAGNSVQSTRLQKKLWSIWEEAWGEWIPRVTHGEPYTVIHNGDAIDGVHHNSTTQWTHNITDQLRHAEKILKPIVDGCEGRYFHVRGTDAHVGQSGENEEKLAKSLGAKKDENDRHARFELWIRIPGHGLVHAMHHIGTTGSSAAESTAVYKELVESYVEAGRWGDEEPRVIVRSHRHRNFEIKVPCKDGQALSIVTPAWQLKTPFCYRVAGARQSQPQIGLCIVRAGDEELHSRSFVKHMERSREE